MTVESRLELCNNVRSSVQTCTSINCETRLTGILSFMLSDEMTTGSVTSTDADKRSFAQRSHSWNILQPRFKNAFPEVSIHLRCVWSWPFGCINQMADVPTQCDDFAYKLLIVILHAVLCSRNPRLAQHGRPTERQNRFVC